MDGKTSISITVNETAKFSLPSITFCPKFRHGSNLMFKIMDYYYAKTNGSIGNHTLEDDVLNSTIAEISFRRDEFLSLFTHPEFGGPARSGDLVPHDSSWVESIPHQELSGKCYTYDSPFQSLPGKWYGLRLGIKFRDEHDLARKKARLSDLSIFIHDRNQFHFFHQDNMPSSNILDNSLFRYKNENSIRIKYSRSTHMSSDSRQCTSDPNYSFMKCVEEFHIKKRGCQAPWLFFPEFDYPMCRKLIEMPGKFYREIDEQDWSRPYWSKIEKVIKTGCPQPCTVSNYDFQYSYVDEIDIGLDGDADWVLYLWFQNFLFKYEEEYQVCDVTCLIGELGGNLGFFLGGSLLSFFDVFVVKILSLNTF